LAGAIDAVASGSTIFIDSTIFVYHFTASSRSCRRLLERCEANDVTGVTSTAVLAEVTHRFMIFEATRRGLVTSGHVAKKLASRPDIVRDLTRDQRIAEVVPLMGVRVESVDLQTLLQAHALRLRHGLLTTDSLVAAGALEHAAGRLATADAALAAVDELDVHAPSDL
jgi:predicted nucleic acid-binding protein